jgi:hypothetical protein
MFRRLWLVAVPFVAGAIIVLTADAAWAFTRETVAPNGNYNFNYGPLDDKNRSGDSTNKSDPNSPGFHFNVQQGEPGGSRSFGFGSSRDASPSQPYFRTFGN